MNPYACTLALRPRTPFEVLDLALRVMALHARPFARLAAWWLLPVWLVASGAAVAGVQPWVVLGVLGLGLPALQAPFTLLCGRLVFPRPTGVRVVLGETVGSAGAVATHTALSVAMAALGLCSGLLLWMPLAVLFRFAPETLLLERAGAATGLRRATFLATRSSGKALMGTVLAVALGLWAVLAVETLGQSTTQFVLQLGAPFGRLWTLDLTPWTLLGLVGVQPAVAVYRLMLYLDVRTELEGWDLQVALKAAAEEA